jgi:hypothetical protein
VNPIGLSRKVRIKGADHDPKAIRSDGMQHDEVLSVQRQNSPTFQTRELENLKVRRRSIRLAALANGYYVMT